MKTLAGSKQNNLIGGRLALSFFRVLFLFLFIITTVTDGNAGEDASPDLDRFKNQTPSERYVSPMADSFFHGYTTVTYADFGSEFGVGTSTVPQILVVGPSSRSGKAESGLQFDATLIFGAVPSATILITTEMHFVRTALDPIITEAKIRWSPVSWTHQDWRMRLVMGRFWWPFGIHNEEWFSNVNRFSLLSPAATEVLPTHYNETGVMLEGERTYGNRFAWNGLLSFGNGVSSFELMDNVGKTTPFASDEDNNRTVTARVGVIPIGKNIEVRLSYANGVLRKGAVPVCPPTPTGPCFPAGDPRLFAADFMAYGLDGTYSVGNLETRSYWYWSQENLEAAPVSTLHRNGGTLEVSYAMLKKPQQDKWLKANLRVGTAKEESLTISPFRRTQYGLGLNYLALKGLLFKLEYFVHDERGIGELDNNGIAWSATANF